MALYDMCGKCRSLLHKLPCFMQVQSTQRNVAANAQRKFLSTFSLPDGFSTADTLQPSFPVELKDVLLLSVSPSGS